MAIVFYIPLANSLKIFYNEIIILKRRFRMNNLFRQAHGGGANAA